MGLFGLFDHKGAGDAHGQVYGGGEPHEGSWTHELIAGAAGFEAMRAFEKHQEREGQPVHHELAKELIAGFAAAEVDKLFESKGLDWLDRDRAKQHASEQAVALYDQQHA
ncbi:DUF3759 domain-containing protein [Nocardia sp. alder85J]|uniref:DUF3759 domain-containing protein n=1 Tax=Nocardia sp. alder85J TaxID=2862949 RepID=UPI001CD42940|nr:DUF3759 domain-containing protein [Nocardia sp. alder85J]MCX4094618.1 DUF3759 domain-containing protein [Nocardia sp. alder85J]